MKEVKMTRNQLYAIYNILGKARDKVMSPKVSYFFLRNSQILHPEIEAIQKASEVLRITPEIEEYNKKQQDLLKELGADNPEYREKSMALYNENLSLIEDYRKKEAEFNSLMEDEVTVNIAQISFKEIPEGIFTTDDIQNLLNFLKESQEELDELILCD